MTINENRRISIDLSSQASFLEIHGFPCVPKNHFRPETARHPTWWPLTTTVRHEIARSIHLNRSRTQNPVFFFLWIHRFIEFWSSAAEAAACKFLPAQFAHLRFCQHGGLTCLFACAARPSCSVGLAAHGPLGSWLLGPLGCFSWEQFIEILGGINDN